MTDKLEEMADVVWNLDNLRGIINFIREALWGGGCDVVEPGAFALMMRGFIPDMIEHYNEIAKDFKDQHEGIEVRLIEEK